MSDKEQNKPVPEIPFQEGFIPVNERDEKEDDQSSGILHG